MKARELIAGASVPSHEHRPSETGDGYEPWALQVIEIQDDRIKELTFFLEPERLFERLGLPPRL